MEDDVDIYADLPSFSLNPEKNNQDCNCKELKKEFDSLVNKLENVEKIKANLERNMSSLLKTAKTEIARKDKMIVDLRNRLDDMTFRRGYRNEALDFSTHRLPHQYTATRKYEDIPSMHSQESEIESHQIQFQYDEYKSKKPQTDVNRIPTLFAERLQKRIMEDEKEDEKQKALLKLTISVEPETKDIPKNNIVENDKENGSHLHNNESDIKRCSNSEPSERDLHRKNLMKRTNEEDDTRRHKRIKIENNEDKTTIEEADYNWLTQYETDKPVQYETKDSLVKFEDRLNPIHSFKKEEVSFSTGHRAASEYREQDRNYTRKNDSKNNSARGHDNSNVRNDLADSSRNSRIASTSNYVSEEFNSGYKKNGYRYSPPRRSYSRNRSDYENFSNHRLRERSSRAYREKKYDDYKYESRYKDGRLKRIYESEEGDGKTRYKHGERGVLRDRTRYSSSDDEDRESSSLYKNKKYENRRMKKEKEMTIVSNDKLLHESNKAAAEINFAESSSRTTVNSTTNYNVGKNIEEHKVKNESEIKSKNSIENTSVNKNLDAVYYLEEGEILDSPEKKNLANISEVNKMEENNLKSIPVEDKNEDIPVKASIDVKLIPFKNVANSTKQEVTDVSTTKIEIVSCLLQENSKDIGKVIQSSSSKIDKVDNCRKDEDICKSYINENLMDSIARNVGATEQVRDIDDNDNNDIEKTSKDSIIETTIAKTALTETKIKETANIESVTKIKELNVSSIENAKKEKVDNPNIESAIEMTEVNNFNSGNSIHKIDSDELRTSTAEVITKVEAVVNCDIEDRDKSQPPIKSEIDHQMSNKSNVETCLNDHNYVQNPFINVSDHSATEKPFVKSENDKVVTETTTSKEMKMEKPINVQSVNSVKRTSTVSSTVKTKKDQQNKGRVISHRRKAVILSDSNASMTVLMNTQNTNVAKTSSITDDSNSALKPRACKILRVKLT